MPTEIYQDIEAKVEHAKARFAEFDRQLDEFSKSEPYSVEARDDGKISRRTWVVTRVEPVPHGLRLAAGDVISNLRSALDHVAYQLVIQSGGGQKPTRKVYFPIANSPAEYLIVRSKNLKCLPHEVLEVFDNTQP